MRPRSRLADTTLRSVATALVLIGTLVMVGCGRAENPAAPSSTSSAQSGTAPLDVRAAHGQNGATALVETDQQDYIPGSVVTISGNNSNGAGYVEGQSVQVAVTGPNGWTSSCTATVAAGGSWSCTITLSADPAIAVGSYSYTATSTDTDGNPISEAGTFTDASHYDVDTTSLAVHGPGSCTTGVSPFNSGATVCTRATVSGHVSGSGALSGGDTVWLLWFAPSAVTPTFSDNQLFTADGSFDASHVVTTAGTWTVEACKNTGNHANCNGANFLDSETFVVTAANTAHANANGPYSGAEGSAIALSSAGSTGVGTVSYLWSVTPTGIDSGGGCSFSSATAANPTVTCTDDSNGGTFTVSLKVTDDNGNDTASTNLTVTNANPVVATPTKSSETNCTVSISASFTDAGHNDTHTATIHWGDASSSAGTVTEANGAGTVTGSHTYASVGTFNITVDVNDDDGGSGTSSALVYNNAPALAYPIPPIFPDPNKSYKNGSTIPVKIKVTGCTAGLTPRISIDPAVTPVKSSGSSNVADFLRYTPDLPGFIYNWSTKGWTNQTYTVRVSGLPGTVVISDDVTLVK